MIDTHPAEVLLRQRLAALSRTLPAARDGEVTAIHHARVATRRLREALPLTTGSKGRKLKKVACRLTRALGEVRELDVALINLEEVASGASLPPEGIDHLRATIQEERQLLHVDMVRKIERIDLDRFERKAVAAARRSIERGRDEPDDARRLRDVIKRASRRALSLQAAIENAGGIYLPDRLHRVRIAVKKLRYTMEIAKELSRSRASARLRTLKSAQDLLGRMHDLEVLIMRIRALQGSDRAPTLKVSADLDRLVRRTEMECRQLHVRYMEFKKKLLELCDYVASTDEHQPASAA
jgi:CHAD domain-containing protein